MNCKQCGNLFNDNKRKPKLLPKCGDSLCADCLEKLKNISEEFRCPFDGIIYNKSTEIFDNAYILGCLNASKNNSATCLKHSKDFELFCLDCDIEICSSCVLFGDHKPHTYEQLNEYKARLAVQLTESQKKLELMERILAKKTADAAIIVQKSKVERLSQIEARYDELSSALHRSREAAKEEITKIYNELLEGGERLKYRLKETLSQITEMIKGKIRVKEEILQRDIKQLEKSIEQNELFKSRDSLLSKAEVKFSKSTFEAVSHFAMIINNCRNIVNTPKSLTKSNLDVIEEDNLLQESFKELMKGSSESPEENEVNERTPKHRQFQPTKSLSPASNFSGNMPVRSLHKKTEEQRNSMVNQTLIEIRKLSLSPVNASMLARSQPMPGVQAISPYKCSLGSSKFPNKENVDIPTNYKSVNSKSPIEKIYFQVDTAALNKSLTLDLSNAGIDDKIMENISKKLQDLRYCKTIKLNNNFLTESGIKSLLKSIKQLSIETLHLNNNNMRETALDYFISFRKYNTSLKCVHLNQNSILKTLPKTQVKLKLLEEHDITLIL